MSDDTNPAERGEETKNPANQTGEQHGNIKSQQRTSHEPKMIDTARGSEVQTRNSSNHRG